MAPIRLDIGCGDTPREGFVGIDRRLGAEAFPLDYGDESVDEIYASHVLEHAPHNEVGAWLADWFRVLRPGGRLRIAVPDFAKIAAAYLRGVNQPTEGFICGGRTDANDIHHSLWDWESARALLEQVGFWAVAPFSSEVRDCSSIPISLNVEAYKPSRSPRVAFVYSLPRYIPRDNIFCTIDAAHRLRWPIWRAGGAYWHHGICRLFERAIDERLDYIVAVDYDTIHEPMDALRVVSLLDTREDVGAVFPVQMRRGANEPLFCPMVKQAEAPDGTHMMARADFRTALMEAKKGHFGLTAIRVDALRTMKRPFMVEQPGENYGDDRIDADVAFWPSMHAAGWRTCMAPSVVVGHLQEFVTWPTNDMRTLHQNAEEWYATGKSPPMETWQCA